MSLSRIKHVLMELPRLSGWDICSILATFCNIKYQLSLARLKRITCVILFLFNYLEVNWWLSSLDHGRQIYYQPCMWCKSRTFRHGWMVSEALRWNLLPFLCNCYARSRCMNIKHKHPLQDTNQNSLSPCWLSLIQRWMGAAKYLHGTRWCLDWGLIIES